MGGRPSDRTCFRIYQQVIHQNFVPLWLTAPKQSVDLPKRYILLGQKRFIALLMCSCSIGTDLCSVSHWRLMSSEPVLLLSVFGTPFQTSSKMFPHCNSRSLLKLSAGVGQSRSKYGRLLALIIESGMIYSASLIIEITLYFLGSNAFYIIYDPIAQLTVSHALLFTIDCTKYHPASQSSLR